MALPLLQDIHDEKVLLSIQSHWIELLRSIATFMLGIGMFLFFWQVTLNVLPYHEGLGFILFVIGSSFSLIAYHFGFIFIFKWLISTVIITDQSLVIIRYLPFVEDDIVYIDIERCHEIDKKQHGLVKNILRYGEVTINAGSGAVLRFNHVRHPEKFVALIETIKLKKNLKNLDLKGMGVTFGPAYFASQYDNQSGESGKWFKT